MSYAVIIPAIETNKYHKLGDLAPFGDTTLLEWKISQCKEFVKSSSQIYISSDSKLIEGIAQKENVNFIKRKVGSCYQDMLIETIEKTDATDIIWINTTFPFMNASIYKNMYSKYQTENLISLVPVERKKEYVFFDNKKLNFNDAFMSRSDIKPIYIMINGCYIIKKDIVLKSQNLLSTNPDFFEIDSFEATEIKDIQGYTIAKEMISIYFKKELYV